MLDHAEENDGMRARIAEVEGQRIPVREVLSWFVPWFVAAILIVVCIGALWCASTANDDLTYAISLIGALLALVALIWVGLAALAGRIGDLSTQMLVEDDLSLIVLMALLGVLAVVGLILAARGPSPMTNGVGYGLCIFGIVLAFANLKHYFDRLEEA